MKLLEILANIGHGDWWKMECGLHETTFLVSPDERKDGFVKCRFCSEDRVSVEDLLKAYKPDTVVETWSPDDSKEEQK